MLTGLPMCDVDLSYASRISDEEANRFQLPVAQSDVSYHLFLYDPMPGGSGLLQQVLEQWESILHIARASLSNCESQCQRSCYNCMRTYRNVSYHDLLDRQRAVEILGSYEQLPTYEREFPALQLAVYLDGLSKGIHGNKNRQQMDRMLRERLEEDGIDVVEIATSDLDDPEAMKRHLKRIGGS